jgi:hypothetical protein
MKVKTWPWVRHYIVGATYRLKMGGFWDEACCSRNGTYRILVIVTINNVACEEIKALMLTETHENSRRDLMYVMKRLRNCTSCVYWVVCSRSPFDVAATISLGFQLLNFRLSVCLRLARIFITFMNLCVASDQSRRVWTDTEKLKTLWKWKKNVLSSRWVRNHEILTYDMQ